MDQGKLYTTQISLTAWFERINHKQTTELNDEDNKKRDRLKILRDTIGLPFDQPVNFPATELVTPSPAFTAFQQNYGGQLWALRLIPDDPKLPKLRLRGKNVEGLLDWMRTQTFDPAHYKADFVPHSELPQWSTIFVVNEHGIFGEVISGFHFQLTQGFHDNAKLASFSYDWHTWRFSEDVPAYKKHVTELIKLLHVPDVSVQKALAHTLNATFAHDYLQGYFETITSEDVGVWFVDYNRLLGSMFADMNTAVGTGDTKALVSGQPASRGRATGTVKIVLQKDLKTATLKKGDILVCDITTPDYVPLIQKAAAVVTDRGGILSHAAIVCRELGKPCIAATGNATTVLKNGQKITVDANTGVVFDTLAL